MQCETSELWNSLECPWKFLENFGNSQSIFRKSDTLQDTNLRPLTQKKLASIGLGQLGTSVDVCYLMLTFLF